MSHIERRGLMLVLSSPSGAGKTTLARHLLEQDGGIDMSVSVTTRPPRPGEVDGRDYFFVGKPEFHRMEADGELLESATVFGHSYGTPAAPVEHALAAGRDILFDIDWQGTQQLMERRSDDLVKVFVLPPSAEVLGRRLQTRASDSAEVIAGRMAKASGEISHYPEYEYVIVNEDLDTSHKAIADILHAERLKRVRQTGLAGFVREMQAELD
ncbi:MAG: guanylate kinase [Hyphomicrobiales bacterium]|nr:MAG: guanylate kinase [Hyphomicrobiales bacterium]